jgi:PKD repeat protein
VDFAQDTKIGLLTVLPLNDPLDILSVKYGTEGTATAPVLVATMKVSDLSIVPPLSNWRMNFAANAPDSRLSPTGDYSFGLSDRGDQFFLRATTDVLGNRTYTYGTAVREHQHRGLIAYTDRGAADSGVFDSVAGTITIKVALSKLNATLAAGHAPIGPGSILAGLRGGAYTTGDDNAADRNDRAKSDIARGGTQYAINSAPTAVLVASPTTGYAPLAVNFDGSASTDPDPGDTMTYTFDFGDGTAAVTQSSPTIVHTYNQIGKYNASLTVKDQIGFESQKATVEINVINRPPTAALTATPTSGDAPLPVNFDGSGSSDPDVGDRVASYKFDFGDSTVITQSNPKISHTYSTPGTYTAKLTVTDTRGAASTNVAEVKITVTDPPTLDCLEDDDSRIAYSNGWHLITNGNASAGHFRMHTGTNTQDFARLSFTVGANRVGSFTYRYAKSNKGGRAEVFIDGVSRGIINYNGTAGSNKSPEFKSNGLPYEVRYDGLAAGPHTFEVRNMRDSVYVDGFCLRTVSKPQPQPGPTPTPTPTATPTPPPGPSPTPTPGGGGSGWSDSGSSTAPGQTTSNDTSVLGGLTSSTSLILGANAKEVSVMADTDSALPIKLLLVDPMGLTVQVIDSVNGVAVISAPVTKSGTYTIKVVNANLGPVQVWTVATPLVTR